MISDSDLSSFYTWCINTSIDVRRTKDKYRDILDMINTNLEADKTPLDIVNKTQCLKTIIELILEGNNIEHAISNVSNVSKYNSQENVGYLKIKQTEIISDDRFKQIVRDITAQSKLATTLKKIPDLEKMIDKLVIGDFNKVDEGYDLIKKINHELTVAINKVERSTSIHSESRVILGKDDLTPTIKRKMIKYDRSNKIPTGFDYIDDNILHGGFEKNRLYIFAGSSGSGKSTILVNMVLNAATHDNYVGDLKNKRKIFLYITLENDKEESWSRIACCKWGISDDELTEQISNNEEDVKKRFTEDINKHNSFIVVEQFDTKSISSTNVGIMIDDLIEEHGGSEECMVAAIYIDYLDLLKSDGDKKDHRLVLQDITQQMKDLAKEFEIPVITATQLNRDAFKVNSSFELNPSLIAESIGKVFIADFVALLAKNNFDDKLVHFKVGKFRSGNPDVPLDFGVNFEHFKFIGCKKSSNPKDKKNFGKEVEGGVLMIDNNNKIDLKFKGCEI